MKKIYLLTGKTGSGKTTLLKKWIEKFRHEISVSGLLSPQADGTRYFENIGTGESFLMESSGQDSIKTGRYKFSPESFRKAREILEESYQKVKQNGWLIIDEFGNLELNNEGLNPSISRIVDSVSDFNLLIVVRERLLDKFVKFCALNPGEYEIFNYQNPLISGWILAGGENSRMGTEKGLLKFGDRTLIEILLGHLKKYFINYAIVSNKPEKYSFTSVNICRDIRKGFGPISGAHSALVHSSTLLNLIITSDMPLLPDLLFRYLAGKEEPLLFKDKDYIQPFPGIYSKDMIPLLEEHFREGMHKSLYSVLDGSSNINIIDSSSLEFYFPDMFLNMNTPGDYTKAKELFNFRMGE